MVNFAHTTVRFPFVLLFLLNLAVCGHETSDNVNNKDNLNDYPTATIYKTIKRTFSTDKVTPYKQSFVSIPDDSMLTKTDFLISISPSYKYQTMLGFGGAFTPSSAFVFSQLNEETQDKIVEMYFSDNGNKYNMARLPIGSCDFSLISYNYDPFDNDYNLTKFNLTQYDHLYTIPFIKKSMEQFTQSKYSNKTDFMVIASPWSAPGWMKINENMVCGLSTCELCKLKEEEDIYQSYSKYLSKFIDYYNKYCFDEFKGKSGIFAITVQNEPGACPTTYEGMHFNPRSQRDFISKYLGPEFLSSQPNTKILIYDHNKKDVVKWVDRIIVSNESDAKNYVYGTAVHWYDGDHFDQLNIAHSHAPDYILLATEATAALDRNSTSNYPSWQKGEHYGHDMIGDFNNYVTGFIDWNLLLDTNGGPDHAGPDDCEDVIKCGSDSMLIVDYVDNIIYPQVFYYYVAHFSRFVSYGSYRTQWSLVNNTNNADNGSDVILTAFGNVNDNDTEVVTVIMNQGDVDYTFSLVDERSDYSNIALFNVSLPAHSIFTVVY